MTGEVTRHPFDWGTNLGRGPSEVWRCVGGRAAGKQAARASSRCDAPPIGVLHCTRLVGHFRFASSRGGNGAYGRLLLLLIAEIKAGSYGEQEPGGRCAHVIRHRDCVV